MCGSHPGVFIRLANEGETQPAQRNLNRVKTITEWKKDVKFHPQVQKLDVKLNENTHMGLNLGSSTRQLHAQSRFLTPSTPNTDFLPMKCKATVNM